MEHQTICPQCGGPFSGAALGGLCPRCVFSQGFMSDAPDSADDPGPENLAGEIAGHRVMELLGRGGMGVIFAAHQQNLERDVAVKVLTGGSMDPEQAARFIREATVLAQLEHPNIVPIHEMGTNSEGQIYYTMKMVKGRTLQAILDSLRDGGKAAAREFPMTRLLMIFRQVCDAVSFAHSRRVLHRDLKPANVMVGEFGEVLVMDWGLAKRMGEPELLEGAGCLLGNASPGMTLDGAVMGTPHFMSPEQAEGRNAELDPRTDVYSLGAILYAILTLQPPVHGATVPEVLANVKSGQITPPSRHTATKLSRGAATGANGARPEWSAVSGRGAGRRIPAALSYVAMKALRIDRTRRYQTVGELAADVDAFTGGFATSAETIGGLGLVWLFLKRHRTLSLCAAAILLLTLGFILRLIASEQKSATSAALAKESADKARAGETSALHTLADSYASHGLHSAEDGQSGTALLWFQEAAALCGEDAARLRLNELRVQEFARHAILPVRAWLIPEGKFDSIEFSPQNTHLLIRQPLLKKATLLDIATESVAIPGALASSLTFHPDGRRIAVASGGTVEIRRLVDAAVEQTIPLAADDLQFSPDGRWLCLSNRQSRIWDVTAGRLLDAVLDAGGEPISARFTGDGTRLLIATAAGARVFGIPGGEPLGPAVPHTKERIRLRPDFLPGGDRFFTFPTSSEFAVWETSTGRQLSLSKIGPDQTTINAAGTMLFNAQGMVSTADGRVLNPEPLPSLFGSRVGPDGTLIVPVGDQPLLLDPETRQIFGRLGRHTGYLSAAAISPDGTLAATLENGGLTRIWKLPTSLNHWRLPAPPGFYADFTPDGGHFAVCGGDTKEVLIHPADGSAAAKITTGSETNTAAFSADGTLLFLRTQKTFQAWRWRDGVRVFSTELPSDSQRMAVSPDRSRIAVVCGGETALIEAASGAVARRIPVVPRQLAYSDDGRLLVALEGVKIRVLDAQSGADQFPALDFAGRTLQGFNLHGHTLAVWMNQRMGGENPCFWSLRTGKPEDSAVNYQYVGVPLSGDFSDDGSLFLFSGLLPGLKVWNWRQGSEVCPDLHHRGWVAAKFIPGTPWIVSAGNRPDPGTVRWWDRATGQPIAPPSAVPRADALRFTLAPDGRTALVGDGTSHLHGFDLTGLHNLDPSSLAPADRLILAQLNSGYRLHAGGLVMLQPEEFLNLWQGFRTRHPDVHPTSLPKNARLRWHQTQALSELRGPASRSWHQKQADEIRDAKLVR